MKNFKLSPTLFLFSELLILLPSYLFVLGVIMFILFKSTHLYSMVISENLIMNFGVTILSPVAGGFFSYQYLERYTPKGYVRIKAKCILAYSIIVVGLVLVFLINSVLSPTIS